jgi:hypothetical protein
MVDSTSKSLPHLCLCRVRPAPGVSLRRRPVVSVPTLRSLAAEERKPVEVVHTGVQSDVGGRPPGG